MRKLVSWLIWLIVIVTFNVSIVMLMSNFHILTYSQFLFSLVSGGASYVIGLPMAFCAKKGYLNWINERKNK